MLIPQLSQFWLHPITNKKYCYYSEDIHHINNKCALLDQTLQKPYPEKGNKLFIRIDLKIFWNKLTYLTNIYVYMDVFESCLNMHFKHRVNRNYLQKI